MSFLKKFSERVQGTISNIASNVNLDRLREQQVDSVKGTDAELAELNFTYVTRKIIVMGFPSSVDPPTKIRSQNEAGKVAEILQQRHGEHFMIWNLSEESYDTTVFQDQVVEYKFPGLPAPPLGLLYTICTSIENWIQSDSRNVAVIHCMTGRGRTSVVAACVLSWLGIHPQPAEALDFVCEKRRTSIDRMTIPSQRRYIRYFSYVLDGIRPRPYAVNLRRIIVNSIPATDTLPDAPNDAADDTTPEADKAAARRGCQPLIQLFKSGQLIFSSAWPISAQGREGAGNDTIEDDVAVPSTSEGRSSSLDAPSALPSMHRTGSEHAEAAEGGGETAGSDSTGKQWSAAHREATSQLRWYSDSDGSMRFAVDMPLRGDILMRCRHVGKRGASTSIFRAAFHTGYLQDNVLRLTKNQLDVACQNPNVPSDFFVELIFAPVGAEESKALQLDQIARLPERTEETTSDEYGSSIRSFAGRVDAYDQLVGSDSGVWDAVAKRKRHLETVAAHAHRSRASSSHHTPAPAAALAPAPSKPSFAISGGDDGSDDEHDTNAAGHHTPKTAATAASLPSSAAAQKLAGHPSTTEDDHVNSVLAEFERMEQDLFTDGLTQDTKTDAKAIVEVGTDVAEESPVVAAVAASDDVVVPRDSKAEAARPAEDANTQPMPTAAAEAVHAEPGQSKDGDVSGENAAQEAAVEATSVSEATLRPETEGDADTAAASDGEPVTQGTDAEPTNSSGEGGDELLDSVDAMLGELALDNEGGRESGEDSQSGTADAKQGTITEPEAAEAGTMDEDADIADLEAYLESLG